MATRISHRGRDMTKDLWLLIKHQARPHTLLIFEESKSTKSEKRQRSNEEIEDTHTKKTRGLDVPPGEKEEDTFPAKVRKTVCVLPACVDDPFPHFMHTS